MSDFTKNTADAASITSTAYEKASEQGESVAEEGHNSITVGCGMAEIDTDVDNPQPPMDASTLKCEEESK